jgi:hypothetical protein
MKQPAIVVFALLCVTVVNAQVKGRGIELGFGVDAGLPMGNDLKKYTSAGIGGDATLGYNFNEHTALLVRGGYLSFNVKDEYRQNNLKSIGDGFMKVCGRYIFPARIFVEPQLGFSSFSSGKSHLFHPGQGITYAAAVGMFLDKLNAFEVGVRYEATACKNGIDFVGLRMAYSIKPGTFL